MGYWLTCVATLNIGLLALSANAQTDWFFGGARALSGDTIVISTREEGDITVRLADVDAVENEQRCGAGTRETAAWSCGLTARLHLVRLFEERGFLRCRYVGRHESGLRTVRCILRGGHSLSYEMVIEGFALALPEAEEALHRAERDARMAGRGIWQGPFDPPWEWRRANPGT